MDGLAPAISGFPDDWRRESVFKTKPFSGECARRKAARGKFSHPTRVASGACASGLRVEHGSLPLIEQRCRLRDDVTRFPARRTALENRSSPGQDQLLCVLQTAMRRSILKRESPRGALIEVFSKVAIRTFRSVDGVRAIGDDELRRANRLSGKLDSIHAERFVLTGSVSDSGEVSLRPIAGHSAY